MADAEVEDPGQELDFTEEDYVIETLDDDEQEEEDSNSIIDNSSMKQPVRGQAEDEQFTRRGSSRMSEQANRI